jgi:cardiolipin synthase
MFLNDLWSQHGTGLLLFALYLLVAARALTRPNRSPASRVAWVAAIMLFPLVGVVAYFLLGETSVDAERVERLREAATRLPLPDDAPHAPADIEPRIAALFELGRSINGFAPVAGNRIALMRDSNSAIDTLIADIDAARDHVHIGFYIWLDDHNGGRVADAVAAAARRGVRCRVLVDAFGSLAFVRSPRWQQLSDAGVQVDAMLDDVPRLRSFAIGRVDLRNHRKIVVIDGRIAYCGSQNCADPEFRVKAKFAPWVDILLRCEGPVVQQEQYLFLTTWISETDDAPENLPSPAIPSQTFAPGVIAQMFGTGPTGSDNAMSDMFVAAMYAARSTLTITTPYFVPDEAILRALCAAPRRGVATTIIFPTRNDSLLVANACRSNYLNLLESGVAVYEYPLGLLHTKSMTIDDHIALVGSANMDRRSLELNYENNLLIADADFTRTLCARQAEYLAASNRIAIEAVRAWPFHKRLLQNAIAMMAPVL